MVTSTAIAAIALQLGAGALAGWGAWRCMDLQRYGKDPRLRALALFFGLFAASVVAHAVWEYQIGNVVQGAPIEAFGNRTPGEGFGLFRPAGIENVTIWLFVHHVLMTASLAVGVVAFGHKRPEHTETVAAAGLLLFFSDLVPLLLGLQAALTLYLAVRAWVNHQTRQSPGALQVALGFLLFFIGHLVFFLAHRPGQTRQGIGDVLTLVGIALLVQVLPRRR